MSIDRKNKVQVEGGMSSMTDLVFLMLIFFIIMSTMSNQTLPVNLPSTSTEKSSTKNSPVEIGVTEDDQYFFTSDKSKFYSFEQIESVIAAKMEDQKEKILKISGDRNSSYEAVLRVIALAKDKEWNPILAYKKG